MKGIGAVGSLSRGQRGARPEPLANSRPSLLLVLTLLAGCSRAAPHATADDGVASPDARISFRVEGRTVRSLTLAELAREVPSVTVTGYDPYYRRPKRFLAMPLEGILTAGFAGAVSGPLATRQFVLRATDGYTVPMAGERLLEPGGHLAVRDLDHPGWEPIGPQRANPAPAYLVWSRPEQTNLDTHPRPWQLAVIEVARFESVFPHTSPTGEPDGSQARRGYGLFGQLCIRCHAINREGGRVGPDLNVPRNITEYRPEAQIREYIRDPQRFRYGSMPAHPGLSDGDLDALIAYLRAMASRKHDADRPRDP